MPRAKPKPAAPPAPVPGPITIRSFPGPIAAYREADYLLEHGASPARMYERVIAQLLKINPEPLIEVVRRINEPAWGVIRSGDEARDERLIRAVARDEADRIRRGFIRDIEEHRGWSDRGNVFFRDRKPYSVVAHPDEVTRDDIDQLETMCAFWNLTYKIAPESWYRPGRSVRVELTRGEPGATLPEVPDRIVRLIRPRPSLGSSPTANHAAADDRPAEIG